MVPLSVQAIAQSQRPNRRTPAISAAAAALAAGSVCGDIALQGETLGSHEGSGRGEDAVRRARSPAPLSVPALIDCTTARALRTWVDNGVASIQVAASYACRTRNNQAGARLSEHANGRAIDISGFGLRSGEDITVLTDWNSTQHGQRLRRMWQAVCGPFGTVLGPEADRFNRDHFHFDTARYRSGSYCR